jgi:hypothetical protein
VDQPYDASLAAIGGTGSYTWSVVVGTLPAGLALDGATGAIGGTPTAEGTSNFTVQVQDDVGDTATQALSITVDPAPPPLVVQTTNLPAGEVDQPYDASLAAIGGTGSYTWSVVVGTLPAGLALDGATGAISGTPTAEGTSNFTVQVQDDVGDTATQALSITVDPAPPAQGTLRISADNGEDVYVNGALLGSSGTWTQGSEYTFALSAGLNVVAVKGIDAGAGPGALIAELDLPTGMVVTDSSWKVHADAEPVGWESPLFDDGGWAAATTYGQYGVSPWGTAVAGIPAGSPAQWIWSANSDGDDVVYFRYTVAVGPVALAVLTAGLPAGEVDQPYGASLAAIGGTGSYTWSVVIGTLPAGLTLDGGTGAISGTPTAVGTSGFTVQVRDGAGDTATRALSIAVVPAPPAQATLRISADNGEDVYVNGTFLGSSRNWRQGSEYTFALSAGLNVVAIKGIDAGGAAALIAELDLPTGMVVTDSSWKVATNVGQGWESPLLDDSAWPGATTYGQYGVKPWRNGVSNIAAGSPAEWIWSANNKGDNVAYLRFSFIVE